MPRYDIGDRALWAYVAGLFDGEGWISLIMHSTGTSTLRIGMGNTDEECVLFVQSIFGGIVHKDESKDTRHKSRYVWLLHGDKAATVLGILLPFLITKRERAFLAIDFNLSPDREYKARLTERLSILNQRGPKLDNVIEGDEVDAS